MLGNVRQIVEDCYHETYEGAPDDGSVWTSGNCPGRVVRGGSWASTPNNLRSATRFDADPEFRAYTIGFRVGRTVAP